MARILSHYRGKDTSLKRIWHSFNQLDWFSKTTISAVLFITLLTPVALTARIVFVNHAADKFYLAVNGSAQDSFFMMKEVAPTRIAPNTATITWTTSAESRSEIKYWKNSFIFNILANFYTEKITVPLYATSHEVNLSEYLEPDTQYKYQITSTTRFGDIFTSPTYSFHTTPPQ